MRLDFGPFGENQGIIDIDAKVTDCVLDLAVAAKCPSFLGCRGSPLVIARIGASVSR